MVRSLMSDFIIGFFVNMLSTKIAPRVLSLALRGTVTKYSVLNVFLIMEETFFLASSVVTSKGMPSRIVRASMPISSVRGIFMPFTKVFNLDSGSLLNLSYEFKRSSRLNFSSSIPFHILSASSPECGPIPILPSRRFSRSFTR